MELTVIGIGEAGGQILDRLLERDRETGQGVVGATVAVNSAKADLARLEHVPEERRVLVGRSQVKGHGVGTDNLLGAQIVKNDLDTVESVLESTVFDRTDAVVLIAGLGGGTGSGGTPVLAPRLQDLFDGPVYGLGVLPATEEGRTYAVNATRSVRTLVDEVDGLILFDNDAWSGTDDPVENHYDYMNEELVTRLELMFRPDEAGTQATLPNQVPQRQALIDPTDVRTVLTNGIASVGRAVDEVSTSGASEENGFLSGLFGSSETEPATEQPGSRLRASRLVRQAALGRLTLATEFEPVERAMVLLTGPPDHYHPEGIADAHDWIEDRIGGTEVRSGYLPIQTATSVTATVVLAGMGSAPRLEELSRQAIEAFDELEGSRATERGLLAELDIDGTEPSEEESESEEDSSRESLF